MNFRIRCSSNVYIVWVRMLIGGALNSFFELRGASLSFFPSTFCFASKLYTFLFSTHLIFIRIYFFITNFWYDVQFRFLNSNFKISFLQVLQFSYS